MEVVYLFAIKNASSFEKLKPNWENQREILDNTLTEILNDVCVEDSSIGLNCSFLFLGFIKSQEDITQWQMEVK